MWLFWGLLLFKLRPLLSDWLQYVSVSNGNNERWRGKSVAVTFSALKCHRFPPSHPDALFTRFLLSELPRETRVQPWTPAPSRASPNKRLLCLSQLCSGVKLCGFAATRNHSRRKFWGVKVSPDAQLRKEQILAESDFPETKMKEELSEKERKKEREAEWGWEKGTETERQRAGEWYADEGSDRHWERERQEWRDGVIS